ncbi:ceramidase domain-containing protein [Rhodocyclus purpureus]|uniref:ceramidase domain-containing protein n=1 Tax=Rhodocyclus purpureus TaxID=1067 RepID=UPI001A91B9CC|nr:ceramidase domain-containing protein [Rhodocyclus purpureus]
MNAIDLYCERSAIGFWAEPVNALSNLSFLCAGLALLVLLRRRGEGAGGPPVSVAAILLTALVFAIGVASFLFHTFSTRLTMLADVGSIFVYELAFVALYARRVAGFGSATVGSLLLAFLLLSFAFVALPREWLNGSLGYVPALLFIAAFAVHHRAQRRREPLILHLSAFVLLLALLFRTLDAPLCPYWPIGTHFLWHLLDGLLLYLTTRAYVLNEAPARSSPPN